MKHTIVLIFNLWVTFNVSAQNNIEEGQKLFKANCSSCHAIDKKLVGPALKGVYERRENKWIIDFVHSSQTMVENGDPQAVALFEEYNKVVMPDHKNLSDVQINNVLAYIIEQSEKAAYDANQTITYTLPVIKPYINKKSTLEKVIYLNMDEPQKPIKKMTMHYGF